MVPDPAATGTRAGGIGRIVSLVLGVVLLGLVAAGVAVVVFGGNSGERAGGEYRVVVPAGTGDRIDRGEDVELIPADLRLGVNDTLVVENQDIRTHSVGPFTVRAGETVRHQFSTAGVYSGVCTIHPSGEVKITVS